MRKYQLNKYMKNIHKYGLIAVVVILLGIGIYNGNKTDTRSANLKIGVIASLTGIGPLGENYVNGAKLALEDYKVKHPEANIELIIENDEYDSKKGISAYKKLTSIDNVDAIVNLSSPTVDAVSSEVHTWNKPWIQLGEEGNPSTDNIIAIFPGQKEAVVGVGREVKADGHAKVVIVAHQVSAYQRFIDGFQEGYGSNVEVIRVNPTDKDMRSTALKIQSMKPDAVAIFMPIESGATLIKRMNETSKSPLPQLYFDTGLQLGIADYKKQFGDIKFLEGSKAPYMISPTADTFKLAYKNKYGIEAGVFSDYGYDSLAMILESYEANSEKWITNIQKSEFTGVSGKIKLDILGGRIPEFKIVTVKDGELK